MHTRIYQSWRRSGQNVTPLSNVLAGNRQRGHGRDSLGFLCVMSEGFAQRATESGGRALQRTPVFTYRRQGQLHQSVYLKLQEKPEWHNDTMWQHVHNPLTVSFNDLLHWADSVGIRSLLQHLIRNWIQLQQIQNNIHTKHISHLMFSTESKWHYTQHIETHK